MKKVESEYVQTPPRPAGTPPRARARKGESVFSLIALAMGEVPEGGRGCHIKANYFPPNLPTKALALILRSIRRRHGNGGKRDQGRGEFRGLA
jgi:hypothetical protein